MKVGLLSDSHGNLRMLQRAADLLLPHGIDAFWHLGDDHPDADELRDVGILVAVVPGTYADEYRRGTMPFFRAFVIEGWRLVLLHAPEDAARLDDLDGVHAILHGHTHRYRFERDAAGRGFVWINPGHLKRVEDRGMPASCGLLELAPGRLALTVLGMDGGTLLEAAISDSS